MPIYIICASHRLISSSSTHAEPHCTHSQMFLFHSNDSVSKWLIKAKKKKKCSIKLTNTGNEMCSLIREPLWCEWNAAFIQLVNEKFESTESLAKLQ